MGTKRKGTQMATLTADETYKAKSERVDELLGFVAEQMAELDDRQATSPNDWGYVGSAGYILDKLEDALGMAVG